MKVTHVSLRPTEAALTAQRPSLTPELMAASGARYSRNNEGLQAILEKIDPANLDKSVDGIFKMIDYGHQSIADMVPVSMFIDGVSLWLAYHVWTLCPTAGGQESSTRYIEINPGSLLGTEVLGISMEDSAFWRKQMADCFKVYQECYAAWDGLARENPALMRIPEEVQNDDTEKGRKKLERMRRNYAFDRARYYLPSAACTNLMLVMSARGWVGLCQNLLSQPLPEARQLGGQIAEELRLVAPRLLRHATAKPYVEAGLEDYHKHLQELAIGLPDLHLQNSGAGAHPSVPYLQVMAPPGLREGDFTEDLKHHENRYAWIGPQLQRTGVRFGWEAVSFAEIRDLNRHRTGTKYCPFVPRGFYGAVEQIPAGDGAGLKLLRDSVETGRLASRAALERLRQGDPAYVYWTVLGTQVPFEHTTTADKFIYEAELRTGVGAHYKYAGHLREALQLWYARFPKTRGVILEGSAEPE